MKKNILLLSFTLITLVSCKKNPVNTSGCWKCHDDLGNNLQTVCGDNEQDAFDHSGTMNGGHSWTYFQSHCDKQ